MIRLLCVFVLSAFLLHAQETTTSQPTKSQTASSLQLNESQKALIQSVHQEELEQHLKYLAGDSLEGRGSATKGEQIAGQYIADYFSKRGITPLGEGETYFQTFPVIVGSKLKENNKFQISYKGIRSSFEVRKDYLPFSFSADKEVEGDLVFAGYGISNEEADYDDYASLEAQGVDIKGKIVLLFRREPSKNGGPSSNGESLFGGKRWSSHATFIQKVRLAEEKGAAGVIICNDPITASTIGDDLLSEVGSQRVSIPCIHVTSEIGNAILMAQGIYAEDLQNEINETLKPNSFLLEGVKVRLHAALEKVQKEARNVIGYLEGTSESLRNEYVLIGAHYDHLGKGFQGGSLARNSQGQIHNGADDNGSGTTALLGLAHALSQVKERPRSIVFMAFSGEELGLLGSAYFVKNPTISLDNCIAMINLDMVGRLGTSIEVVGAASSPSFTEKIETLNQMIPLVTASKEGNPTLKPSKGFAGNSDHASFYRKDIPVMFFFTGIHKDYHRPTDDWDKINFAGLKVITQLVGLQVLDLLDDETRPAFQKIKMRRSNSSRGRGSRVRLGIMPEYNSEKPGVSLTDVVEDSPAQKGGMQGGDRIIKMGTQKIQNIYDLMDVLGKAKPGEKMDIVVIRDGKETTIPIQFEAK